MKGNNLSFITFCDELSYSYQQNFWCRKFWVGFNEKTKNIGIYAEATTQLHRALLLPFYDEWDIKWNQEQTSFIAFGKRLHRLCLFDQV